MHFILLAVGIFLAIVGVVLIRYGVPLDEYGNSPLLMSGMVALVGGVLACGLFFVVRSLSRIAERLEIQPLLAAPIGDIGRPPVRVAIEPPPVRPEPVAPPAAVPPPEIALEAEPPRVEPRLEPPAPPPAPQRTEPVVLPTAQPRVDVVAPPPQGKSLLGWLGGKQRAPAATRKAPDEPAAVDLGPLTQTPQQAAQPRVSPGPAGNGATPPVPPPTLTDAAVYKSGVIDGMAYTLYTDGSIEAQLPQGPIRFASVEALQSYLVGR